MFTRSVASRLLAGSRHKRAPSALTASYATAVATGTRMNIVGRLAVRLFGRRDTSRLPASLARVACLAPGLLRACNGTVTLLYWAKTPAEGSLPPLKEVPVAGAPALS